MHFPPPSCALNLPLPLFPSPHNPLDSPAPPVQSLQTLLLDLQAAPVNCSWGAHCKPQAPRCFKEAPCPRVAGQKASDGSGRCQSAAMSSEILGHSSHLLGLSFLPCEMRIRLGTKNVNLSTQQTPGSSYFSSSRVEKRRFLLQNCIFRWDYSEPARLAGKILQFSQIPLHR